ncbi:N(G),N(G)-dimethylarginine dimethylaminohydrolase 1-like [Oppia nitens]|uniref:N(G),N(G)-dimethylarginine dimethylaminohydrolase 1-like n=1 Tax=Oppia nitens TaxID=1686743 RepID=UPI0023DC0786|nr:N(G),N(G)-dimethylarginine dimethylaminohydrolase 1-like [Oppia nitens]
MSSVPAFGRYSHAIVSRIPNSFVKCMPTSDNGMINVDEARREHEQYCKVLRSLGLDVIELPQDETFPESPFVDDTAVVINGVALICRPGHPSRVKEVDTIRAIIKKELKLPVVEIADPKATIDGGDVLFTGREIFVGLSQRTNESGARAVAAAFPEYPVTPIRIPNKLLHLKSCLSMAGNDILCVSASQESQEILRRIVREATHRYHTLTVPENSAANCLYINGTLIYRSEFTNCGNIFEDKIDYNKIGLKIWELSKPGSNLTSLAILVRKARQIHTIV